MSLSSVDVMERVHVPLNRGLLHPALNLLSTTKQTTTEQKPEPHAIDYKNIEFSSHNIYNYSPDFGCGTSLQEVLDADDDDDPYQTQLSEISAIQQEKKAYKQAANKLVVRAGNFSQAVTKENIDGLKLWTITHRAGSGVVCAKSTELPRGNHFERSYTYFEIKVLSLPTSSSSSSLSNNMKDIIVVGIAQANYSPSRVPGYDSGTFGFRSDGKHHAGSPYPASYDSNKNTWSKGDIIGVLLDWETRSVYYTKNGRLLPAASQKLDLSKKYVAIIATTSVGQTVAVNFGRYDFCYKLKLHPLLRVDETTERLRAKQQQLRRLQQRLQQYAPDLLQQITAKYEQQQKELEEQKQMNKLIKRRQREERRQQRLLQKQQQGQESKEESKQPRNIPKAPPLYDYDYKISSDDESSDWSSSSEDEVKEGKEHQPAPRHDDPLAPLKLSLFKPCESLRISAYNSYIRLEQTQAKLSLVVTEQPLPKLANGLIYFEVTISRCPDPPIFVVLGLLEGDEGKQSLTDGLLPGLFSNSIGWYGDDGSAYWGSIYSTKSISMKWIEGSTLGIGVDTQTKQVFFVEDGHRIAHRIPKSVQANKPLYACVAIVTQQVVVDVNFGVKPFRYEKANEKPEQRNNNNNNNFDLDSKDGGDGVFQGWGKQNKKKWREKLVPANPEQQRQVEQDLRQLNQQQRRSPRSSPYPPGNWTCVACTFAENEEQFLACSICGTERPKPEPKKVDKQQSQQPDAAAAAAAVEPLPLVKEDDSKCDNDDSDREIDNKDITQRQLSLLEDELKELESVLADQRKQRREQKEQKEGSLVPQPQRWLVAQCHALRVPANFSLSLDVSLPATESVIPNDQTLAEYLPTFSLLHMSQVQQKPQSYQPPQQQIQHAQFTLVMDLLLSPVARPFQLLPGIFVRPSYLSNKYFLSQALLGGSVPAESECLTAWQFYRLAVCVDKAARTVTVYADGQQVLFWADKFTVETLSSWTFNNRLVMFLPPRDNNNNNEQPQALIPDKQVANLLFYNRCLSREQIAALADAVVAPRLVVFQGKQQQHNLLWDAQILSKNNNQSNQNNSNNNNLPVDFSLSCFLVNNKALNWDRIHNNNNDANNRKAHHSMPVVNNEALFCLSSGLDNAFLHRIAVDNNNIRLELKAAAPVALSRASLVAFHDKLYLFGGLFTRNLSDSPQYNNKLFMYWPAQIQWTEIQHNKDSLLPPFVESHAAVVIRDSMYIVGGQHRRQTMDKVLVYRYHFPTKQWSKVRCFAASPNHYPCHFLEPSVVAHGDSLWLFGGSNASFPKSSAQISDNIYQLLLTELPSPASSSLSTSSSHEAPAVAGRWMRVQPQTATRPPPLCQAGAVVYKGHMLLYGGVSIKNTANDQLWSFHFASRSWKQLRTGPGNQPPKNPGHAVGLVNDTLVVLPTNNYSNNNERCVYRIKLD